MGILFLHGVLLIVSVFKIGVVAAVAALRWSQSGAQVRTPELLLLFFFITLGLEMSDTKVYEP